MTSRIDGPLFEAARETPERIAIVEGDRTVDYSELAVRVRDLAGRLLDDGLAAGDRVSVHLDKSVDQVVALYAAWSAGGIAVPINEGLRSRQVEHIVRDSGSRFFVTSDRKLRPLAEEATAGTRLLRMDDLPPDPITAGERCDAPVVEAAAVLYTSGSTGRPKGILVSHDNLLAGARIVTRYLEIRPDERLLSVLPFSFDYGLNQLLTSVGCGATLVLQRSTLPADICRTLTAQRVTAMAAVPPMWIQLLQGYSPFPRMEFPDLRYITNTGGVFPVEAIRRYREIIPHVRIYLMYGLSEAFRSTYLPPDQIDRRPTSMGRAIPECEMLVLDDDGRPAAPGVVGELVHRGPTVALGYWNDEQATARVFRPDPAGAAGARPVVYSGDLVRSDDEGYLYFVGRRDQLIKSHGYRISPGEVEETVFDSGLVAEVVACGLPDPLAGAVVVVHCVPAEGFSEAALLDYCRREMPRYMIPREFRVHERFPRTASGKIDRKAVIG